MALGAVDLPVAAGAALQILSRRLTVPQQPNRPVIVIARAEPARPDEADLHVALAAEDLRVVATRALRVTAEGIGGVPREEVRLVIATSDGSIVAAHAERFLMTRRARRVARCGEARVSLHEEDALMAAGGGRNHMNSRGHDLTPGGHRADRIGNRLDVAGRAVVGGVARSAFLPRCLDPV